MARKVQLFSLLMALLVSLPIVAEDISGSVFEFTVSPRLTDQIVEEDLKTLLMSLEGDYVGTSKENIMFTQSVPGEALKDGSQAFEKARNAKVTTRVGKNGVLHLQMEIKESGLKASAKITNGGESGVLKIRKAQERDPQEIVW